MTEIRLFSKEKAFANEQVQRSYSSLRNKSNELKSTEKSITGLGTKELRNLLLKSEKPINDDAT